MSEMRLVTRPTNHPGRHEALCDGEVIVKSSRQPCYDGARALLARGVDPETFIQWHNEHGTPDMRGKVGELAKWTVEESDRDGLRRRRWRPNPRFLPGGEPQD